MQKFKKICTLSFVIHILAKTENKIDEQKKQFCPKRHKRKIEKNREIWK